MKLWKVSLSSLALLALAGSANACIQVYPYSEICRNPVGFVLGLLP